MSSDIFSLRLGLNSCYLIRGRNTVMIDGGMPNKLGVFRRKLSRLYIHPEEIKLMVLTHSHFDHAGSAKAISEFTGAKVAIHESETSFLENREFALIEGVHAWGRFSLGFLMPFFKRISFPEVKAEIVVRGKEYPLSEYGIDGKIFHTPGHTCGSMSVLLDTGEAFVGCMAHDGLPFRWNPGLPIYAQNMDTLKESWRLLIDKGAKMIFPGHGNPFPVEVIKRGLSL
jgi:hydroxyacylglutathione hydrolase